MEILVQLDPRKRGGQMMKVEVVEYVKIDIAGSYHLMDGK